MSFSWPYLLLLLLAVPLLLAIYIWMQRRRRKFAVRYASLALVREALPRRSRWRRHVPFALFLLALAALALGVARPQATAKVPLKRASIILAMDVSGSMCATDVPPNRLTVAQEVARDFIRKQEKGTRIGLVAFAGYAQLVVPPTTDREVLIAAIDAFKTARGTAVGSAILKAIDAVAEINPNVQRTGLPPGATVTRGDGDYEPDIIVLLTDGATTQGVNPIAAAEQAAERAVRVYTIGFGTSEPAPLVCSASQLGADSVRGFGGQGGPGGPGGRGAPRQFLVIDEDALQQIADLTGGEFQHAEDADQLERVFRDLPAKVALQDKKVEVSVIFAALGAAFAIAAVGLSLAWNRYP